MITIILFQIASLSLIYLLWRINRTPSKGIVLLCKFALFLVLGVQFFSIFQYGSKTAGVPAKVTFFEDFIINSLKLPNLDVQWLSFIFFMVVVIFCLPKNSKK